jgi:endonuclease/exonuclease/phosphatase family metal-dependent hydrolase
LDNYIFINAHLSSKEEKNKGQIEDLKKGLLELKKTLPDYSIIVGGDLNSYLEPSQPFNK